MVINLKLYVIFCILANSVFAGQYLSLPTSQAPVVFCPTDRAVPNSYIVVLKNEVGSDASRFESHMNFANSLVKLTNMQQSTDVNKVDYVYDSVIYGYSADLDSNTLEYLRYSEDVSYIEQDSRLKSNAVQNSSPWGLARISQRGPVTPPYSYTYNPSGGTGVNAYILDTGINIAHVDFHGRAIVGAVIPSGETTTDCIGHGTHVAGIVGSSTYGVAKNATLIAVKVFRCNGTGLVSNLISGISWALNDHITRTNTAVKNNTQRPKGVANISASASLSNTLNTAVDNAVKAGLFIVKSAGNSFADACKYSPASSSLALTVAAIDSNSQMSVYSNYGSCVNIFAPGNTILSTFIGSNTATAYMTGTSMSAPHVTGIAALAQSKSGFYPYNYTALRSMILGNATTNAVKYANGTANLLAYSLAFN